MSGAGGGLVLGWVGEGWRSGEDGKGREGRGGMRRDEMRRPGRATAGYAQSEPNRQNQFRQRDSRVDISLPILQPLPLRPPMRPLRIQPLDPIRAPFHIYHRGRRPGIHHRMPHRQLQPATPPHQHAPLPPLLQPQCAQQGWEVVGVVR